MGHCRLFTREKSLLQARAHDPRDNPRERSRFRASVACTTRPAAMRVTERSMDEANEAVGQEIRSTMMRESRCARAPRSRSRLAVPRIRRARPRAVRSDRIALVTAGEDPLARAKALKLAVGLLRRRPPPPPPPPDSSANFGEAAVIAREATSYGVDRAESLRATGDGLSRGRQTRPRSTAAVRERSTAQKARADRGPQRRTAQRRVRFRIHSASGSRRHRSAWTRASGRPSACGGARRRGGSPARGRGL